MLVGAQIGHQGTHPGSVAGCRADMGGEGRSGRAPAGAAAPLGPVLGHAQAQRRQVEHLPGLEPDHRRVGQLRAAAAAPLGQVLHDLIGMATWARWAPGAPGCLPGRRRPACSSARRSVRVGLPSPSEDGGLDEIGGIPPQAALQLGHPRLQRGDQAGLLGIGRAQLGNHRGLHRNGGFRVWVGGRDRGLQHTKRSRPLAHGPSGTATSQPQARQLLHASPQRLKLVEAQPARRWACPQGTRTWIERRRPRRSETA
jgi:hypothetical protein